MCLINQCIGRYVYTKLEQPLVLLVLVVKVVEFFVCIIHAVCSSVSSEMPRVDENYVCRHLHQRAVPGFAVMSQDAAADLELLVCHVGNAGRTVGTELSITV